MSLINQIAELEKAKAKLAQLEAKLSADRVAALAKLPEDYGYENLSSFISALKAASLKRVNSKKSGVAKNSLLSKNTTRTRTKITPELKAQVIAAVQEGKSGAEISHSLGLSLPSVQNIKKEAGLVKVRTPSSSEAPAS